MAEDWNDEELRAAIVAYRDVVAAEAAGQIPSPTQVHRALISGPLAARSEGSVARRMSNLSAVFKAEGLPVSARYSGALTNVGVNVTRRILAIYAGLYGVDATPTADQAMLKTRVRSLRGKLHSPPPGVEKPETTTTETTTYVRDPKVCAFVLDRAKGQCEACGQPAPFMKSDGEPFLEVHHVVQLSENGPDTVDNAIAACPNCHRRLHNGHDRAEYRATVYARCSFLRHPASSAPEQTDLN